MGVCCGAYMGMYCSGCPHYDPEITGKCHLCGEPWPCADHGVPAAEEASP